MKLKALFGLYGLILMLPILQSCCEEEYKYIGIDQFEAFNYEANDDTINQSKPVTLITGPFRILTNFTIEYIAQLPVSFINTSYATSCSETYVNSMSLSEMTLTLDRPFFLNGDSIPASSDLLSLDIIDASLPSGPYSAATFDFTQSFFDMVTIENGEYVFSITAESSDGIVFVDELTLTFEL